MYYKVGKELIEETDLNANGELNIFGNMTNDSFLCRILECYDIKLNYDLAQKQLVLKDISNNEILKKEKNSYKFNGNNVSVKIHGGTILFVDIKRENGLDISARIDFSTGIDYLRPSKMVIEKKYSKYGSCQIKNNGTGYYFVYDTNDLNRLNLCNKNSIFIKIKDSNNTSIDCGLINGKINIYQNTRTETIDSKKINTLLNSINPLTNLINSDLQDLISFQKSSIEQASNENESEKKNGNSYTKK